MWKLLKALLSTGSGSSDEGLTRIKSLIAADMSDPEDEHSISAITMEGLDGEWLDLGKNELHSNIYLRLDNITRMSFANLNICAFDRMISNEKGMNEHGDKSTIIHRLVNFDTGQFKDLKFSIYEEPMCVGAPETFELEQEEVQWTMPGKDSWDEAFNDLLKNLGNRVAGMNIGLVR